MRFRFRHSRDSTKSNVTIAGEVSTSPHPFSADRPIKTASDDRLNRTEFAKAVADAISAWRGRDSLVVALYGPWGVGKTSLVNLVKETTNKDVSPPLIVQFNPWEWSGHEELAKALFAELELALRLPKDDRAQLIAAKLRAYALVLDAGAALSEGLVRSVAAIGTVLVLAGLGTAATDFTSARWVGVGVAVLGAAALVLSHIRGLMLSVANMFGRAELANEKSLDAAKRELGDALTAYDRTVLIVVDDIDRLAPADVARMLQVVKANADLPGLVFLLAFDRQSVAKSIRAALRVDGDGYLDKVVQVGFDVPAPDISALQRMLFEGLDRAIESQAVASRFDQARWQELYARGIAPFFQTPRSIIRFLSTLQLTLNRQVDGGECNVDPVDFIGVEVLRFFEPKVYRAIVSSKDGLTGTSTGDTRTHREVAERLQGVFAAAATGSMQRASTHVVTELFPAAEWVATGVGQIVDHNRLLAGRRVASREAFDRYFQFSIPTGDISEGEVSRTAALATEGKSALVDGLRAILDAGRMPSFLLRLTADPTRVPGGSEGEFIGALFDLGDSLEPQVERTRTWQFAASETLQAEFLAEDMLERLESNRRMSILEEAIHSTSGVHLPLDFVEYLMPRARHAETPGLAAADLEELSRQLIGRVEALAREGSLDNHRHLASLVYSWERWGEDGAAGEWCENLASSPEGLATLVGAFAGYGRATGGHALSGLIDLDGARDRASRWATDPAVGDGDRQTLASFLAGDRMGMWRSSVTAENEPLQETSVHEAEAAEVADV